MTETRLVGWKAISAYLRRDRSTVMRWYRERGLPVRRVPGGKQATVFAVPSELDAWLGSSAASGLPDTPDTPEADEPADVIAPVPMPLPMPVPARRRWLVPVLATALVASSGLSLWAWSQRPAPPVEAAHPSSPELERIYVSARERWAERTPASLMQAIRDFETLTRRDPQFAPGFVGLAECYLLAREFGAVDNAVAYPRAEAAARTALRLDPQLYSAHRAIGFVEYWWNGEAAKSGEAFREALRLAPGEPQTLHWYANVLADNGAAEASLDMFARAIAIAPGRIEVALDHAWAQWSAGNDDMADQLLRQLAPRAEHNAVYYAILGDVRLVRGDWRGYVDAFAHHAALREDPALIRNARALRSAEAQGEPAIAALTLAQSLARAEGRQGYDLSWSAMIASTMGDRGQLVAILRKAAARHETWGMAGYQRRIASRWQDDSEVIDLLAQMRDAPVLPATAG